MNIKNLLFLFVVFVSTTSAISQITSKLLQFDVKGKLKYIPDSLGNVIPDFSNVGYKNGEAEIPLIPVVKTIYPVAGDNTANIQNALNELKSFPLDSNNIRGALLLKAGVYPVNGTLNISRSGMVIRGEGAGSTGTVLVATKQSQYDLLTFYGNEEAIDDPETSRKITDKYVPIGAHKFTIEAGHTFASGDFIFLQRKPNQAWISMLGMDSLTSNPKCIDCIDWTPEDYTMDYKRTIVAVQGNLITIDAPIVDPIDSKYAEGSIRKFTWPGKIENVGVENIRFDSEYASDSSEDHGWNAIVFSKTENSWVKDIEAWHFGYSAVSLSRSCSNISILNSKCMDPISQTIGSRKYSFNITGQRTLVKNCFTRGGRHDYVTGPQVCGPNVFVNCVATQQNLDIGPHHRWATGILFDNVTGDLEINVQNRIYSGTGHGWAGAQVMLWNCTAPSIVIQSPPRHINWAIGCKGVIKEKGSWFTAKGFVESAGTFLLPSSLYEKQLCDRIGKGIGCPLIVLANEFEENADSELTIYPNPLHSAILKIQTIKATSGPDNVQIIDVNGLKIAEFKLGSNNEINLNGIPKGIYILKINLQANIVFKELIIQ